MSRALFHHRSDQFGRNAKPPNAAEFFNVLTSPEMLDVTEPLLDALLDRLQHSCITVRTVKQQRSRPKMIERLLWSDFYSRLAALPVGRRTQSN
jgi:hypothetical protein